MEPESLIRKPVGAAGDLPIAPAAIPSPRQAPKGKHSRSASAVPAARGLTPERHALQARVRVLRPAPKTNSPRSRRPAGAAIPPVPLILPEAAGIPREAQKARAGPLARLRK